MSLWARPLLALASVLFAAGCLAGFQAALNTGTAWPIRLRSAIVSTGAALMAAALMGLALTTGARPWVEIMMLGIAVELGFALADTWLRRRAPA